MSTPSTPSLSHADAARLWMSSRDNPMVVTAVLPLDGALDLATLRALLDERLAVRARFRALIDLPRLPWNRPHWREDPAFSIERHVERIALPPDSTEADLARAVSELRGSISSPNLWANFFMISSSGMCLCLKMTKLMNRCSTSTTINPSKMPSV